MKQIPHRLAANGLAVIGLMLSPWMLVASAAEENETNAVKASDFLDSIGACTHITQGEDAPSKVAECLTYTGIRDIRDDGSTSPKTLQSFIDVHKASGAKVVPLPINGNIAASLEEYETLAAAGVSSRLKAPTSRIIFA